VYRIAHLGGIGFPDGPLEVQLCDFRLHRGERFFYEYDFSDGRTLEIRLEGYCPLRRSVATPVSRRADEQHRRRTVAGSGPTWQSLIGTN
jgi:hypothetical protein